MKPITADPVLSHPTRWCPTCGERLRAALVCVHTDDVVLVLDRSVIGFRLGVVFGRRRPDGLRTWFGRPGTEEIIKKSDVLVNLGPHDPLPRCSPFRHVSPHRRCISPC